MTAHWTHLASASAPAEFWALTAVWLILGIGVIVLEIRARALTARRLRNWLTDCSNEPHHAAGPTEPGPTLTGFAPLFLALALFCLWRSSRHSVASFSALSFLNGVLSLGVGFSCLSRITPNRRSGAHFGLAHLTLAWISLWLAIGSQLLDFDPLPPLSGVAIAAFPLAISGWWWSWLGRVWRQQLDHQVAWTVTGALIPVAARFAAGSHVAAMFTAIGWTVATPSPNPQTFGSGMSAWLLMLWAVLFLVAISFRIHPPVAMLRAWPLLTFLAFLVAFTIRWFLK